MSNSKFGYLPNFVDFSGAELRNIGYTPNYTLVTTNAGAQTLTTTELLGGLILNDPGGTSDVTTPTAAAIVGAMSNPRAGSAFLVHIRNTGGVGETTDLVGGTSVTVSGTAGIAQNNAKSFLFVVTSVVSGSEAITAYSLGTVVF